MYGSSSDTVMGYYPPRVAGWRWLYEHQVGVSTPSGAVSTRETTVFVPGLSELEMYGRIYDPGMGCYPPRVAMALRTSGCGFHAVRGGIDPGDHRFRPQFVGFVYI